MRITAGILKGKLIKVPRGIRPTTSFTRKRIFDVLGDVKGMSVLDLFAGSGALGIEALSRGAKHCTFVDISGRSVGVILRNLRELGIMDLAEVMRSDALEFCRSYKGPLFDIILADPPYSWDEYSRLLDLVMRLLQPDGRLVLELSRHKRDLDLSGYEVFRDLTGGDTRILILKKSLD